MVASTAVTLGWGRSSYCLEVAFVVGLDVAALLGVEVFVEDVRVVEVPGAGADGDESEKQGRRDEPRSALQREAGAGAQGVFGSAAGERDGDDAQHSEDRQPVGDRPEQRGDEVAVAVHVGVGVGGDLAEEVERVLPAEVEEDGHQHEDADHDAVAHELVRHDGLHEQCEQDEDEDLREGDEIELLEVLQQLVVVVAGDGLHDDADQHGDREQDELDDHDRRELGEPVGGLSHGQRVVDAVEMGVALAPDQLRGVEGGDDEEKEQRAAFDGLHHEVGDGPDVLFRNPPGEMAVVDGEGDDEGDDGPERNLAHNVAHAQPR